MENDILANSCKDWRFWVCLTYEWQTLITGILALVAAGATIWYMRRQILAEDRRHKEIRDSQAWAARARLPGALSAMCSYTEECANFVLHDGIGSVPTSPDVALQEIRNAIEFVEPQSAKKLFEVIVWHQVQNARMRGGGFDQRFGLYDVAKLRAMTDQLFEYARDEEETALFSDVDRQQMITGLRSAVGFARAVTINETLQPVIDLIERRHH